MTASPLSVLMALDQLASAGTETHVLSLTKALIRRGNRVSLVSADGECVPRSSESAAPFISRTLKEPVQELLRNALQSCRRS
ncbi:hypothetical protein LJK88_24235 [Paenibacillus sp. P26]|nr:hypothetical protein LJK88_24235 [Paenibacillus sp. P26]